MKCRGTLTQCIAKLRYQHSSTLIGWNDCLRVLIGQKPNQWQRARDDPKANACAEVGLSEIIILN